ncbi:MAG TPA: hypothetical protein VJ508_17150, partial [Saprospiraceae bacterium]|nr:hypothetical protein [Saprospiraceae bacterium]
LGRAKPGEKIDAPTRKPPDIPKLRSRPKQEGRKKNYARVVATSWDSEHKLLQILDEDEPGKIGKVHYAETGVNDLYSSTLELAIREIGLPLTLGLHEILCTDELDYTPSYIIIMPDLLLDVTDVAEFTGDGHDPGAFNILKQFLPSKSTPSLLIGKVSNYFLDEMIRDEQLTFKEAFARSFKLFPMEFVRLDDQELSGMMAVLERHFQTIRNVINDRFPVQGIKREQCTIEPTYYSPSFGLKGRLDLFYQHEEEKKASIIELKSSRPFKPNSYGLSSSHYHQTLLYDLLIKSVYGDRVFRLNFILYSSEAADPLRHAVSVDYIQKETIQNRNQLVLLQYRLVNLARDKNRDILAEIDPERFPSIKGFIRQHMEGFRAVYTTLTITEKKYLQCFTSFIAREHMLARIGNETGDGTGGLAGLWLDSLETKETGYQILTRLELISVVRQEQQTLLTFHRSENTNKLANFRAGDIAILYPHDIQADFDPTKFQLHRAVILELSPAQIQIRLRNNQVNLSQLQKVRYWNVEHDLLDSSFRSMYQSLWALMNTENSWRQIILGQACPP